MLLFVTDILVKSRLRYVKRFPQLTGGVFFAVVHLKQLFDLGRRQFCFTSSNTASGLGCFQLSLGSFLDQTTLKLGQCSKNVEYQLAAVGGGIHTISQGMEALSLILQGGDHFNQVR